MAQVSKLSVLSVCFVICATSPACRVVAVVVQGWSGLIQRSIYRQIKRAHKHSKWEHKQDTLKRRAALALHAQGCATSSGEDTDGSATPPSRQSSQGELGEPLLRRGKIAAGAEGLTTNPSPFEMITTGIPELDEGHLTASRSGTLSQGSTDVTSANSSDADDICCVPDVQQGWGPSGWQSSGQTRLRPSSSFVNISQGGINAAQLQPRGSLPLSVERNLHVQGRSCNP